MTTGHVKDWHAIYIFWRQPLVSLLGLGSRMMNDLRWKYERKTKEKTKEKDEMEEEGRVGRGKHERKMKEKRRVRWKMKG